MSKVQFIDDHEGNPAFVVVPIQLWKAWGLNDADLSDNDLLEKALLEGAQDEVFPNWVVEDLTKGTHPIKVYAKLRGLRQKDVCEKSGLDAGYLSNICSGNKPLSAEARSKIAPVLRVDPDMLVPWK